MITNQVTALREKVEKKQKLRDISLHFGKLKKRQDELNQFHQEINSLADIARLFKGDNIEVVYDKSFIILANDMSKIIQEISAQFEDNFKIILDNYAGMSEKEFGNKLNSLINTWRNTLLKCWKEYINTTIYGYSASNEEIERIRDLEQIPAFKPAIDEIQQIDNVVSYLSDFPKNSDDIKYIKNLAEKRKKVWDKLKNNETPQEVLKFIKHANSGEATLDMLTPIVLDWLKKQNMINSIRIKI